MAICWERTVPLAFHVCCFYSSAVLTVGVPFPFGVYESRDPVPDSETLPFF